MFVLCPHCHFLVGIDPRTGKPPAHCPKCGGLVVEPLPDIPAASAHAEEAAVAAATPLAPFAPVELPSVLPTLPEVMAEPEPEHAQETGDDAARESGGERVPSREPKPKPEPKPQPKPEPESPPKPKPKPEPKPEPESAPADVAPARVEPEAAPVASAAAAATPAPKLRWWSRRKPEPEPTATQQSTTAIASAASEAEAPIAMPAPQSEPESPQRADAMIAALQVRRRTTKKPAEPPPPPVVAAVEVEVDALPPAVRIEDVVAVATPAIEAPEETPAETTVELPAVVPAVVPAGRSRQAPVATTDVDPPLATRTSVEEATATAIPAAAEATDAPAAPHPLRRRTDFDPTATPESIGGVPPHPLRRRTDAPSFTRPRVRTNVASRIGWRTVVAVGGLTLLLVLQLLLAQRDTLAASPRWRPMIASVCAGLGCGLPPWQEPAAFTMLSRDVRPHPGAPGSLLINASFRNDARWSQPWPRLLLTLSDLDGRMVGARSFAADEYLGAAPTQSELAPGQTAAVTLSVVEPAPNIVAFTFDFR